MPLPKNLAAYAHVQAKLDRMLERGNAANFTFPTRGEAIKFRQFANRLRELLQVENGWSPYDHLVFGYIKDDPKKVRVYTRTCPEPEFTDEPLSKLKENEERAEASHFSPLATKVQRLAATGAHPDAIWSALMPQAGDEELRLAFVEADVKLPDHVEVF